MHRRAKDSVLETFGGMRQPQYVAAWLQESSALREAGMNRKLSHEERLRLTQLSNSLDAWSRLRDSGDMSAYLDRPTLAAKV